MSYSSKGFDIKKVSYTTITHEGEIENDKQRILNKFNFFFGNSKGQLTSSVRINNFSNTNEPELVNKINTNPKNNNEKKEENIEKYSIQLNTKYNTAQKSTKANSIQQSRNNLLNNENKLNKKEKRISPIEYNNNNNKTNINNNQNNNNLIKINVFDKNSSKVFDFETLCSKKDPKNKIKSNKINTKKTMSSKLEEKENEEINSDSDTKKESKELNFKTKNLLSGDFDVDRESDSILDLENINNPDKRDESYLNNNKLSQNGEYEPDNNIHLISPYHNTKDSRNNKYTKLFVKNPNYLISNRLIDEFNEENCISANKSYKFISKIREENQQIIQMKIKNILKLNDYSIYHLLSFCYERYNDLIKYTNKYISKKIQKSFSNIFEKKIFSFQKKYKNFFEVQNFFFEQKNFIKHKRTYPFLNLVISCKIITEKRDKSIEFGYNFKLNSKNYNNIWKIDIKKKSNIILWISSELEQFNNYSRRFCYIPPISTFSNGDSFILEINIFSKNGSINPNSIEWTDVIINDAPDEFFEKKPIGKSIPYDALRACEIENMIHLWKVDYNINNNNLINEFKKIFEKKFQIENIVFDISKIYFYKIKMIAKIIGKIPKNIFTNFDIDIIPYDDEIINEIQCIGLLNTVKYSNSYKIRLGTNIIFYLTDIK